MPFEENGFPSLFWALVCLTGLRFGRSSAYDARGVLFVVIHEYAVVLRAHLAEIALRTEVPRGREGAVLVSERESPGVGGIPHLAPPIQRTQRVARCGTNLARRARFRVRDVKGDSRRNQSHR